MENKHTIGYAKKMARENNTIVSDTDLAYAKGFYAAVKVNKVPETIQSLITLQKRLELLILCTPSGEERNRMTDENMLALSLINELS